MRMRTRLVAATQMLRSGCFFMKWATALAALAFASAVVHGATETKHSGKSSSKLTSKSAVHSTASRGSGQARTGAAKSSSRTRGRGRRRGRSAPAPSYQLHPDPERYQQIQQALADKGYFKGQVNGQWGDDSVDALKRFQADQKLEADGKINALSLRGLGLGPRHDGSSSTASAPSAQAPSLPPAPTELPASGVPPQPEDQNR